MFIWEGFVLTNLKSPFAVSERTLNHLVSKFPDIYGELRQYTLYFSYHIRPLKNPGNISCGATITFPGADKLLKLYFLYRYKT